MDDFVFISKLAEVPDLRARFVAGLRAAGVAGDELEGWALVLTELVNNAIEHGCLREGDRVRVGWSEVHDRIVVRVSNPGEGCITEEDFDVADCDDFADTGRGAGLFIIRAWADEVRVHAHGATTEVEVSRRRAGTPREPSGTER